MKLNIARPFVESSGQMEEQFFSIKDTGMIFDILRSKMYSNPILAICREISCNARDAHREVGKPDEPITIVLPNQFDWNYRVKDNGPGISPDRISNIFIQYTASTKRDDDIQHGGFGLGCKTPFSYTDSFTVITTYNGIKYQYACYIDETKVGKLALLSQEATMEPNGAEIVVPVEPKDAHLFAEWTEQACRHWIIKPIIKAGTVVWQSPTTVLKGKDWSIVASSNDYNRTSKVIIDGIEYPLSLNTLHTYANTKLINSCHGNVLLYFGIGELTLSANREQIYLDKATQEKISLRLKEMQQEIKGLLDAKIQAFPDLWQANLYYRKELSKSFHDLNFLGPLQWQGIELHGGWISVNCPAFTFTKGKYTPKYGTNPNKISRSRTTSIHFEENSELFINDLSIKEPTPKQVKKAFDDNLKLRSIQILCPTDTVTEAVLNASIHLDQMAPRKLSELTKVGRAYTAPSSRLLVFKLHYGRFLQVSYASIDEDPNHKVLCLLEKRQYPPARVAILNNYSIDMTTVFDKSPQITFYGVDQDLPKERVQEEFGDFEPLQDYIENKLLNNKTDYIEMKLAHKYWTNIDNQTLERLPTLKKQIIAPNSIFLERAALHQKIKDITQGDIGLLQIYERLKGEISQEQIKNFIKKHPGWDYDKMEQEYNTSYPLLEETISHYHYPKVEHISQYVNLIDTWNQNKIMSI